MIVFVAALAAGATGAFFSDTETSTGNVFTAGSVTLSLANPIHTYTGGGVAPDQPTFTNNGVTFALEDLKPLDSGNVAYDLTNQANPAYVCARVVETGNAENTHLPQEITAGDTSAGAGELQNFLSFKFANATGTLSTIGGQWHSIGTGTMASGSTTAQSISYCFGDYSATGTCIATTAGNDNQAQTDSVTVDLEFYAEQTRNNPNFTCESLNTTTTPTNTVTVSENDLALSVGDILASSTKWYFYNDANDTVMSIDQFSGTGGANHFASHAGTNGAAYMKLDTSTSSRYNIATSQFGGTLLSAITDLSFRIEDATTGTSQMPFLTMNIDFNNSDAWQKRLVYIPATVSGNTVVDAIQGGSAMWEYSGTNWPAGVTSTGTILGTTARSWNDIKADYPSAKLLTTGAFLGIRVGHPGPVGEEGYVDWVKFNGTTYDFSI